jgi:hypothetical protein
MKFRVPLFTVALLALSSLTFAQPKSVSWDYPGDWVCDVPAALPLTYGTCWTGTPIPDGTILNILVNGTPTFQWPLNGDFVCHDGYFSTIYYDINAGSVVVLDVVYQGCHYTSRNYTISNDETFLMFQSDWTTCQCTNPGCEVKEEQSSLLREDSKSGESSTATGTTR